MRVSSNRNASVNTLVHRAFQRNFTGLIECFLQSVLRYRSYTAIR